MSQKQKKPSQKKKTSGIREKKLVAGEPPKYFEKVKVPGTFKDILMKSIVTKPKKNK